MTNPLEKPESERLKDLRELREKGYQPWALVLFIKVQRNKHNTALGELVSYPFATKEGYKVNMRTEIGDPMSMIEIGVDGVWTPENLAETSNDPFISDFLKLIGPVLRNRNSC